ncbi:MAG: hypothetical protein Q7S56_04080 [Nanoarchaeota archaeon]|nr:hypothetical protein [Nanoarchaeota archaeon]
MRKVVVILLIAIFVIASVLGYLYFTNSTVYNLSQNFKSNVKVISYGTSAKSYDQVVSEFKDKYPDEAAGGNVYFIFGNTSGVKILGYQNFTQGSVNLAFGNENQITQIATQGLSVQDIIPNNNKVEIVINDKNYNFKINEGEFIYIMVKEL